jgi:DNA-binding CsgD family transcriptional regulator
VGAQLRVPERKLLSVVDTIHRAGVEPDAGQEAVDGIQALLPMACVALHGHQSGAEPRSLSVTGGWDPELVHAYRTEWIALNPYPALIPKMEVGAAIIADESEFIAGVRKTQFYNDFLLAHDFGSAVGVPLWNRPERVCFLAIDYSVRRAAKLNKPTADIASLLASHLARSFAVSHRLAGPQTGPHELTSLLNRITGPALVVDHKRRVRSANAAGEALLRSGKALKLDKCCRVKLSDSAADAGLDQALAACFSPVLTGPPFTVSFRSADHPRPAWLNIVPLLADDSMAKGPLARFLASRERLALLIVSRSWEPPQDAAARLASFNMTPAEARLATALMEGLSLDDYARDRGIAVPTARNQLQSLFEKTRTHRQGELIAVLFNELTRAPQS